MTEPHQAGRESNGKQQERQTDEVRSERARIVFTHPSRISPNRVQEISVTTRVPGRSNDAVIDALAKAYPRWDTFTVMRVGVVRLESSLPSPEFDRTQDQDQR